MEFINLAASASALLSNENLSAAIAPFGAGSVSLPDWRGDRGMGMSLNFPKGIVFVDTNVEDAETLLSHGEAGYETVQIDSTQDGIAQITETLTKRSGLSSLHIVAHGEAGNLRLGSTFVNSNTLDANSQQLQTWAAALTPDADILLYGCNVAASEKGKTFVQHFSQLVGADIAASDNLTGSAAKGGDWELEVNTGKIEAKLAFASAAIATYDRILSVNFSPATNINVGTGPVSVAAGNFNADTIPDLAVANFYSDNVSILLGNNAGGFIAPTNFNAGTSPRAIAVGNFNADTFSDLAVANTNSNDVSILLGNGTGSFSAPTNFGAGKLPRSVVVGNFNADAFSDLAVANEDSNDVSILLGNGAGSFSTATNFSAGIAPRSIVTGNFNADTISDLAVANNGSANVSILLGNGTGGFSAPTNFGAGNSPYSIAAGNFNADTIPDLAVANENSNNVSILLGNGTGGFFAATNFGVGTVPRSIVTGNFNADDFTDLAVANDRSNSVSILLGNGSGGFSTPSNFSVGNAPYSVAAGNFNADTFPDLAVANLDSNNVSILLNTTTTVSITATNTNLAETTSVSGTYRISRTNTAGDLTVNLALDRTSNTVAADYTLGNNITVNGSNATVIIPDKVAFVDINFTPVDDTLPENDEILKLNLAAAATYDIDRVDNTATIAIAANDRGQPTVNNFGIFNLADFGSTNGVYLVDGIAGQPVPLQFDWVLRDAIFNNEIGFYLVDDDTGRVNGIAPQEAGYAQIALSRSRVLFASGQSAGAGVDQIFHSGDRLIFYTIQNSTTANFLATNSQNTPSNEPVAFFSVITNLDSFDHVQNQSLGNGSLQVAFEDLLGGGDRDFNDIIFRVGVGPVQIPGTPGQTTETTFSFASKDAIFDNELGLFLVDDPSGKIGNLSPGDREYVAAAVNSRQVIFQRDRAVGETTLSLPSGKFIAFYLIQNSTAEQFLSQNSLNLNANAPKAFFSFISANPDGVDRFWRLSGDEFGFEDLFEGSDRDFNDLQFRLRFRT